MRIDLQALYYAWFKKVLAERPSGANQNNQEYVSGAKDFAEFLNKRITGLNTGEESELEQKVRVHRLPA